MSTLRERLEALAVTLSPWREGEPRRPIDMLHDPADIREMLALMERARYALDVGHNRMGLLAFWMQGCIDRRGTNFGIAVDDDREARDFQRLQRKYDRWDKRRRMLRCALDRALEPKP